ncbi:hypothetical protein BJV77DRAFT_324845 [Russula vinacea]|nr:hypothetical protein BJV77DRAFT_324845 [Russula vinacea]
MICVTHVCRQWRETALNYPRLWSDFNFTKLTQAAVMAEIFARAQTMPLNLEADVTKWSVAQSDAFERQLEAHISHTRHLNVTGRLHTVLKRLASSAPILESLSLSNKSSLFPLPQVVIPVNLFNWTAPKLTRLELDSCDISWKSPLLRAYGTSRYLNPTKGRGICWRLVGCFERNAPTRNPYPRIRHPTCTKDRPAHITAFAHRYTSLPHRTPSCRFCDRLCVRSRSSRVACSQLAARECRIP